MSESSPQVNQRGSDPGREVYRPPQARKDTAMPLAFELSGAALGLLMAALCIEAGLALDVVVPIIVVGASLWAAFAATRSLAALRLFLAPRHAAVSLGHEGLAVTTWWGKTTSVAWEDLTGLEAFAEGRRLLVGLLTSGVASASGVLHAGGRKVRLPDLKQAQEMHASIVRRAGLVKLKETPWVVTYGREASVLGQEEGTKIGQGD
jgi:hypothetical protein